RSAARRDLILRGSRRMMAAPISHQNKKGMWHEYHAGHQSEGRRRQNYRVDQPGELLRHGERRHDHHGLRPAGVEPALAETAQRIARQDPRLERRTREIRQLRSLGMYVPAETKQL